MKNLKLSQQTLNSNSQNPINKMWQRIEKKKARNERLRNKLNKFAETFKQDLQPTEERLCQQLEAFILHLINFINKKTIKGIQRETLYDWIHEELSALEANPFRTTDTSVLRDKFQKAMIEYEKSSHKPEDVNRKIDDSEYELMRAMLHDITGQEIDISDEDIEHMIKHPEHAEEMLADIFARLQENESIHEAEDESDFDKQYSQDHSFNDFFEQADDVFDPPIFKQPDISKLYRQLAKILHPDKESDPEQKNHKKELMQQLSQFKKDQDIFGLFTMAQQWIPGAELNLDEDAMDMLFDHLACQASDLDREHNEIKLGRSLEAMIWQRFGGKNKKQQQQNLSDYTLKLEQEIQDLNAIIKDVKTVKAMQAQLRLKQQESMIGFGALDDDDIADFMAMFGGEF